MVYFIGRVLQWRFHCIPTNNFILHSIACLHVEGHINQDCSNVRYRLWVEESVSCRRKNHWIFWFHVIVTHHK